MKNPVYPPALGRAGLMILLAGQLLPMIDFSIVNVALDAIARSLDATPTQLELIVAIYGVAFAVCLAMGGRLGDNFGRRRLFCHGVWLFGFASLLCGLAGTVWMLLLARALQGVGAALIVPQILATLHVSLRGREHSRALGLYGAIGGLAFVVGQVLGGFLVSADIAGLGWRSVFLINLPICVLVLGCARLWVPETRQNDAARIDRPGTVLLAVPPLLWALWRVELHQERRGAFPLLPPALLRLPSVRFGLLIAVLFFSCWSGFMFVVALLLQSGAGLSPFQSGNAFITLGVTYFLASLQTARLVERFGKVVTLRLGCVVQMTGLLVLMLTLSRAWPQLGVLSLVPGSLLIGSGQALIVSCFFRIGLSDVPVTRAGAGGAMLTTVQQAALGLGPALLGAVFAHRLHTTGGDYLQAVLTALAAELCLMAVLVASAVRYRCR